MRPAWEQDRDDILKQSMHRSRGKIGSESEYAGRGREVGTWSNVLL